MARRVTQNNIYVPEDPKSGPSLVPIVILLFFWPIGTLISAFLGFKRLKAEWTKKRYREFRRYANTIGNRGSVSVRELASRLGKATSDVMADLQAMIDQGIIGGEAYIDRSNMMLYLDSNVVETDFVNPTINVFVNSDGQGAAETVRPAQQTVRPTPTVEKKPQTFRQEAPKRPQPEPRRTGTDNADFEAKLQEIRRLNDEIEDEAVSQRIDRIGELTSSIFRVVREKPERAEEVRKFMNYYLPTTFKLLKSYSLMEKQSYQGENIVASRKKIEDVLDTLIHAFEKQQDRLFQTEALDVETDISVLETMMASDGLLENKGLQMRPSGGGEA